MIRPSFKTGYLRDGPLPVQSLLPFASAFQLIPESQWYELDRRPLFDARFAMDQGSSSACVAVASTMAAMKLEAIQGNDYTKLSWQFLYNQINYGIDIGSNIVPDAMARIVDTGICREELFRSPGPLKKELIPSAAWADAKNHQALDVYRITTWEEIVSAILMQTFLPVFPVRLGQNFGQFLNAQDIAGVDVGIGNHAVHADGVRRIGGQWCVDCQNSYLSWGRGGRGYLISRHVETAMGPGFSGYVIRAMKSGPLPRPR